MEEHFDVYDDQNGPLGAVPRSRAHREGLWHHSAHLWLTDGAGSLLLQRRSWDKQTDPGRWDIAVAGHLSAGQTPLEAVVREAHEELGLTLDPADLTPLGVRRKEYQDEGIFDREWQHAFAAVWAGPLSSLVLQAEEVIDVRWLSAEDFRRALEARDSHFVDRSDDWDLFDAWRRGRA